MGAGSSCNCEEEKVKCCDGENATGKNDIVDVPHYALGDDRQEVMERLPKDNGSAREHLGDDTAPPTPVQYLADQAFRGLEELDNADNASKTGKSSQAQVGESSQNSLTPDTPGSMYVNDGSEKIIQPSAPSKQCGCFPAVPHGYRVDEAEILRRPNLCCYCCCVGFGCNSVLDPCFSRCACACWHCACSSADLLEPSQGLCSQLCSCCVAAILCQLPIPGGAPCIVCCNERYCIRPFKEDTSEQMGNRISLQAYEQAAHILRTRTVPCFFGCCGCIEAVGRDLCSCAVKACCCRCDQRLGLPIYPGCGALTQCGCLYAQAMFPCNQPEAPICACCTLRTNLRCETMLPKRCPKCCEKLQCCRLSMCECCSCLAPRQQEMS